MRNVNTLTARRMLGVAGWPFIAALGPVLVMPAFAAAQESLPQDAAAGDSESFAPVGSAGERPAPHSGSEASGTAGAEAETGDSEPPEELLVTGTRFGGRTSMDSAVPIDSFKVETLQQQGNGDMTEILKNIVPSFAATSYTGDGSAFIRSSSLRGLPPDETLVLVNRKRRHRSALVALGGAAMNQGAQAVDVGMIPTIALRNMEVLRDGAAAQYGSDAIAGVINYILKDNAQGGEVQARVGQWYGGEHEFQIAGNLGLPLGPEGFLSLSAEYTDSQELSRGGQHEKARALTDMGVQDVPDPAQVWGRPQSRGLRLFWNGGLPVTEDVRPYFFGSFARTYGNYGFFYREPNKSGVSTPLPLDPMDPSKGNFSWSDQGQWPVGFTPRLEGFITDFSQVAGVGGAFPFGVQYDLSGAFGMNRISYTLNDSINPSWGPESPTVFKPGDLQQRDLNFNADFSYGITEGLNLAWGAEWRSEEFTMYQGDDASWQAGRWSGVSSLRDPTAMIDPMTMMSMPYTEPLIGANGYQGTSPDMAGAWTRTNWAFYADTEWDANEDLLLQGAGRFENFSSFGSTLNGKLAARYTATDFLTLRGAASTGFRAPTPGQSNLTNVATVFVPGTIEQQLTGTVRPTDEVARPHGGRLLQPEKSVNVSFGFTTQPTGSLRLTADAYRIAVEGRIVMAADIDVSAMAAPPGSPTYQKIRFYTNGLDTVTTGLDVVLLYDLDWADFALEGAGDMNVSLAYNFNRTKVAEQTNIAVNERRKANIENALPRHHLAATATQNLGKWSLMLRANYYGSHQDEDPQYSVGGEVLLDAQLTYRIDRRFSLMLGANNMLNNFPDEVPTRMANGLPWPRRSPVGYHGGMVYLRGVARL